MGDMINHPSHYTQASVPLEPIDVLRYAPFDLGNCLKYVLRAGHKGNTLEDWEKALKYAHWTCDSSTLNPMPYHTFFCHYAMLLFKFEAFEGFADEELQTDFNDFMADLLIIIEHNIAREKGVKNRGG